MISSVAVTGTSMTQIPPGPLSCVALMMNVCCTTLLGKKTVVCVKAPLVALSPAPPHDGESTPFTSDNGTMHCDPPTNPPGPGVKCTSVVRLPLDAANVPVGGVENPMMLPDVCRFAAAKFGSIRRITVHCANTPENAPAGTEIWSCPLTVNPLVFDVSASVFPTIVPTPLLGAAKNAGDTLDKLNCAIAVEPAAKATTAAPKMSARTLFFTVLSPLRSGCIADRSSERTEAVYHSLGTGATQSSSNGYVHDVSGGVAADLRLQTNGGLLCRSTISARRPPRTNTAIFSVWTTQRDSCAQHAGSGTPACPIARIDALMICFC